MHRGVCKLFWKWSNIISSTVVPQTTQVPPDSQFGDLLNTFESPVLFSPASLRVETTLEALFCEGMTGKC